MESLGTATTQFGFDIFKELNKTNDGNILFSPVSISTAIGMILLGTQGTTSSEIQKVLYSEKGTESSRIKSREKEVGKTEDIHHQFQKFLTDISKFPKDNELKISNRLFGEKTYPFIRKYIEYAEVYYHASLEPVDFVNAADESRKKINSWVESQTHEKVGDLFPEGSLSSTSKLVLINTVYFKGLWDREFKKAHTKEEDFWLDKNTRKPVQMMAQCSSFSFTLLEDLQAQIVGIPYKNDLSMFILLPSDIDGLEKIVDQLSPEKLVEWTNPGCLERRRVDLWLPRLQLEGSYELESALEALGMRSAFSEHADFSGMSARSGLHAHKFLHRSCLVVTEEGAEGTAGTGVGFRVLSTVGCEPVHCTHPFLFFIRHREADSVLFFGRFSSP